MPLLLNVEDQYKKQKNQRNLKVKLIIILRITLVDQVLFYYAERLSKKLNNAKIYFKRDELNHTGAHKINNCIGQVLLAKKWEKKDCS